MTTFLIATFRFPSTLKCDGNAACVCFSPACRWLLSGPRLACWAVGNQSGALGWSWRKRAAPISSSGEGQVCKTRVSQSGMKKKKSSESRKVSGEQEHQDKNKSDFLILFKKKKCCFTLTWPFFDNLELSNSEKHKSGGIPTTSSRVHVSHSDLWCGLIPLQLPQKTVSVFFSLGLTWSSLKLLPSD